MRTILIAVAVVAVVVFAYFAVVDMDRGTRTPGIARTTGTEMGTQTGPGVTDPVAGADAADENVSNRLAGDAATDRAFESAQDLEEPVQSNLDASRAIAAEAGAVGGEAFTVEGYDRPTVQEAILASDLPDAEKERLMFELDTAAPQPQRLEAALAEVRLALATE